MTRISPGSGTTEDNALYVTVNRAGFTDGSGLAVELNFNEDSPVSVISVNWVNSTLVEATFDLTGVSNNLGEPWDVMATNPDGHVGTDRYLFTTIFKQIF